MGEFEDAAAEALGEIQNTQLSAVTFLSDHVELQFRIPSANEDDGEDDYEGPLLTACTPPQVHIGNTPFCWGDKGYRDNLCERIGQVVQKAFFAGSEEDKPIHIILGDGAKLFIPTNPKYYRADQTEAVWLWLRIRAFIWN